MLLSVQNLASYFYLDEGVLRAVDGVSFEVAENETVALVGESGCGKTIIALSILKLIPPPGQIVNGQVSTSPERLRRIRATESGIVFQEPGSALNPVYSEDWPAMPTVWHEFELRPCNFFSGNPALDSPK